MRSREERDAKLADAGSARITFGDMIIDLLHPEPNQRAAMLKARSA